MINLVNPLAIVPKASELQVKQKSELDFNDFLKGSDENDDSYNNQLPCTNIVAEVNSANLNKTKLNLTNLNPNPEDIEKETGEGISVDQFVKSDLNLNQTLINSGISNNQLKISAQVSLPENDIVNFEVASIPQNLNEVIGSGVITTQNSSAQNFSGYLTENNQIKITTASTNQQKVLSTWTLIPSYKMDYINSAGNTLPANHFHFQYAASEWHSQNDKQNYLIHSSIIENLQVNSRYQFMFHLNDVNIDKITTLKVASNDDLKTGNALQYATNFQNSQWSKFIMRWAANLDGTETIWVRDYSLDAENSQQLLVDIRTMANQSSVQLSRVMINGQEIWLRNKNL